MSQVQNHIVAKSIEVLEGINESGTTAEVFDLFNEFALSISIEKFIYNVLSDNLKQLPFSESVKHCTFSAEWVGRYRDQNYFADDPLISRAIKATKPFHWYELENNETIMENQRRMLGELRAQGFVDGLAVPVFGPDKVTAFFGLGSYDDHLDFSDNELLAVQLVCQTAHLKNFELAEKVETGKFSLSNREQEILEWISAGKSNDVIGEILGISRHTVDTHVKRILAKFNTNNRISAVVIGLQLGILRL